MPGGLIQIVAYGIQDVFLTADPQITFFKVLYRRYTNFSIEPVPQYFNTNTIQFGQKVSCTLSRTGDLVHKIYLVVDLPSIPPFISKNSCDSIFKFAWVRKIGFAMIKSAEIEIGGQLIDKQYSDWMYIWDELTNDHKYRGFDNMIGNIPELTKFTNGKSGYRLHIPLQFWFCRHVGLSLPIVALQYNEVKINIEIENQANCFLVGPTQCIEITNSVVHYQLGEWIQQKIGSRIAIGMFIDFDIATGKLYYIRASDNTFLGFNPSTVNNLSGVNLDNFNQQYGITGLCSNYTSYPKMNALEKNIRPPVSFDVLPIPNMFLDVQYVYLDLEERFRFINTAHEYLIEQLQIGSIRPIQSKQFELQLSLNHPNRALFWIAQLGACININDRFNYTNSVVRDLTTDKLCGKNLVSNSKILLNSVPRFETQPGTYFNWIQPYQYFIVDPEEGVNVYSFGLNAITNQPAGTCNMSKMDFININVGIDPNGLPYLGTKAQVKVYGLSYNILRVINGLGGVLFSN